MSNTLLATKSGVRGNIPNISLIAFTLKGQMHGTCVKVFIRCLRLIALVTSRHVNMLVLKKEEKLGREGRKTHDSLFNTLP